MHSLLFIEDDDAIRLALTLALEDEGYEVREAEDGKAGLAAFAEHECSMISDRTKAAFGGRGHHPGGTC